MLKYLKQGIIIIFILGVYNISYANPVLQDSEGEMDWYDNQTLCSNLDGRMVTITELENFSESLTLNRSYWTSSSAPTEEFMCEEDCVWAGYNNGEDPFTAYSSVKFVSLYAICWIEEEDPEDPEETATSTTEILNKINDHVIMINLGISILITLIMIGLILNIFRR